MKILITGTPGVGKTTLSNKIAAKTLIKHIDITEFIKNNNLFDTVDPNLDTLLFNDKVVRKSLKKHTKNLDSFIIDTHSPSVAANIPFDYIFHIICQTKIIAQRLTDRGYSEDKITVNIDCEIFNVIGEEVNELFKEEIHLINGSDIPDNRTNLGFEDVFKILNLTE